MHLKVKLARLSLCHCGYGLLKDDIKVGAEYTIETDTMKPEEPFVLRCGGCGCITKCWGSVMANSRGNSTAPFNKLPLFLFDMDVKGAG
jgi:hypothetical protein